MQISFTNPQYLWGLLGILIPLVIHLFNFRRYKKVYFSNVKLLKELHQQNRKSSRLKHILVLINRMLVIVCLVLVFAGPFIPEDNTQNTIGKRKAISVYLDNTLSMEAHTNQGQLFTIAKKAARNLIEVQDEDTRIQLLSADKVNRNFFLDKEKALDELDELWFTPKSVALTSVINSQERLAKQNQDLEFHSYIFSDFQRSISPLHNLKPTDSLIQFHIIPVQSGRIDNISIDTCWFLNEPVVYRQNNSMMVRLLNDSEKVLENITVRIEVDGKLLGVTNTTLQPGLQNVLEVPLVFRESGWKSGKIYIDDYPVTYDDKYYFSILVKEQFNIALLNDSKASAYLPSFFENDSSYALRVFDLDRIPYEQLKGFDMIVVNEPQSISSGLRSQLMELLDEGVQLMAFPDETKQNNNGYQEFFTELGFDFQSLDTNTQQMSVLDFNNPYFKKSFARIPEFVEYPEFKQHLRLEPKSDASTEPILHLTNGDILLYRKVFDNSQAFVWTSSLKEKNTSLAQHTIFFALMNRISKMNMNSTALAYNILTQEKIRLEGEASANDIVIRSKTIEGEWIPSFSKRNGFDYIGIDLYPENAGAFQIISKDEIIREFSLNIDRRESNFDCLSKEEMVNIWGDKSLGLEVNNMITDEWKQDSSQKEKNVLFRMFIYLTLLFLAIETLILRFMK